MATEELQELAPEECWRLLRTEIVGRLAVTIREHPFIFPVNYAVDDTSADEPSIVLRTADGTKLHGVVHGPSVALEIDHVDRDSGLGWSVVVAGPATLLPEPAGTDLTIDLRLGGRGVGPLPYVVRLAPHAVTGRRLE